jgi:hypothetical protein
MAERKSIWRWISFVNMACIASVIDVKHYVQSGTINTWLSGWQPAHEHPLAACFNILFDLGSVLGMFLTIQEAVAARRIRKREKR